MIVLIYY